MHGHTQSIISSSLSREQTGHDVPRWMPFRACNSLLRSFQPRLACNHVVCSRLVQECGGGPAVGSTSHVSSRRYSNSPYTGCHTEFKLRLFEMESFVCYWCMSRTTMILPNSKVWLIPVNTVWQSWHEDSQWETSRKPGRSLLLRDQSFYTGEWQHFALHH